MEKEMRKDEELMVEFKLGKEEVLEEIFNRYKNKIFNYALRFLGNRADAEDVVSQTFLNLIQKKEKYNPETKFSSWLYTIAHNICIDRLRKKKRVFSLWSKKDKESKEYREIELEDLRFLPYISLEEKETLGYIKKAIKELPRNYREVIILKEYHNLRYQEISKILNCSVGKVKILLFRARKSLRKKLSPLIKESKYV
jgi:RNA polymerase sigma-70 factor (ECF subfamily)